MSAYLLVRCSYFLVGQCAFQNLASVAVGAPSLYLVGPLSVFPSSVGLMPGHARSQSPLRAVGLSPQTSRLSFVASCWPPCGPPSLFPSPLRECSRSLEAGPYPGQPPSRRWQVAWAWGPVSPPDFRFVVGLLLGFALWNPVVDLARPARKLVSVFPPEFCSVVGFLLGFALGAPVVDLARWAVSQN